MALFPRAYRKNVSPINKEETLRRAMSLIGQLAFAVKDESGPRVSEAVSTLIEFYVKNARLLQKTGYAEPIKLGENNSKVISSSSDKASITTLGDIK